MEKDRETEGKWAGGSEPVSETMPGQSEGGAGLKLVQGDNGPSLRAADGTQVSAASELLSRPRQGKDLLLRAVGSALSKHGQPALIVDATAGLGADAFHLAARGRQVLMIERVPEIAALLRATLDSALAGEFGPEAAKAAGNLDLVQGDAKQVLAELCAAGQSPNVVLLDPMYPDRGKAALPPKGMAVFRDAVGQDDDAEELLAMALKCATDRVVVKRPVKAGPLGGLKPSGSLTGRTVRFDLYAPKL